MTVWNENNEWERIWWGNCDNTYGEETKQLVYVKRMGFETYHDGKSPFNIDMQWRSVIDIGGGPVSILLKCHNLGKAIVVDPCDYPKWVYHRYKDAGIELLKMKGEDLNGGKETDIVLCYNVLQHVDDPGLVIKKARRISREVRLFEWIDTGVSSGHPNNLTEQQLNYWLDGEGKVEDLKDEGSCSGRCYYGIFRGDRF